MHTRLPFAAVSAVVVAFACAACGPSSGFSYTPSNVPAAKLFSGTRDLIIDSTCEIVTDEAGPSTVCSPLEPEVITQSDGQTKAALLVVRDLTINTNGVLRLYNPGLPLIIGASGKVTIEGRVLAAADRMNAVGGGSVGTTDTEAAGRGPGAGGKADSTTHAGAGGGGHCGAGGNGGNGTNGGTTYGTATLEPLRGGSSGGSALNSSGAGGGAVQISALGSITVTVDGVIHAGGGAGSSYGGGGGAGGAILLEAPTVTIAGVLAADGGGGAANLFNGSIETDTMGKNATADAVAAPGGTAGSGSPPNLGGNGAAGATAAGAAGAYAGPPGSTLRDYGGGGGGGAGRIRINTKGGTVAGTPRAVSPSDASGCSSTGTVKP